MSDFVFINGDEDVITSHHGTIQEALDAAQTLSNQRKETVFVAEIMVSVEPYYPEVIE